MAKKWIIFLCLGGLAAVVTTVIWWMNSTAYDGPMTIDAARQAATMPGASPVTFTLSKKPHVEYSRGHAHSPLGVSGHNVYQFDGELAFDGTKGRLESKLHPTILMRVGRDYYLLLRGWFPWDNESLEWRTLSGGVLVTTSVAVVPPEILKIRPVDMVVSSVYRTWVVEEFLSGGNVGAAAGIFAEYVKADPHFAFDANRDWRSASRHGGLMRVLEGARRKKAGAFYDSFVEVLKSATSVDDPQDIGLVGYTLVNLKPAEGRRFAEDYVAKIKAAPGPASPDVSDLEWRIKP